MREQLRQFLQNLMLELCKQKLDVILADDFLLKQQHPKIQHYRSKCCRKHKLTQDQQRHLSQIG